MKLNLKNHWLLLIDLVLIILLAIGIYFLTHSEKEKEGIVRVDVAGAVIKPGVYEIKEGAILEDIIKLAGGFSKKADKNRIAQEINLAKIVLDGEKIFIPLKEKAPPPGSVIGGGKVNVNTADQSQLETLPGIGPVMAQRIIDFRTQGGRIKSWVEFDEIKGVGPALMEKLKDKIEF